MKTAIEFGAGVDVRDVYIAELGPFGMPLRVINQLESMSPPRDTLYELLMMTQEELKQVPHVGEKSIKATMDAIERHRKKFKWSRFQPLPRVE